MINRVPTSVVVGGGLAGRAAAVALAQAGIGVTHLAPPAPPDRRSTALMGPSVEYLIGAGLIADPAALGHRLGRIRLIDATGRLLRAPETLFDAREAGLEAFGWNFPNFALHVAFETAATSLPNLVSRPDMVTTAERNDAGGFTVTLSGRETIVSDLVVAADGRNSLMRRTFGIEMREHRFGEAALVADIELERGIGDTSVEFHYPHGPFTLVPAGERRANLVWIDERAVLDAIAALGPGALEAALAERSHRLFGVLRVVSPTAVFPLSTLSVETAGQDGLVLVGEAAHAFPPIGAQGLNLGLRDIADLSVALDANDSSAAGWAERVSADYAERRAGDLARTGAMVDGLFRSLLSDMLPAQVLRATGIWGLKSIAPLRRHAFRLGMGVGGR